MTEQKYRCPFCGAAGILLPNTTFYSVSKCYVCGRELRGNTSLWEPTSNKNKEGENNNGDSGDADRKNY